MLRLNRMIGTCYLQQGVKPIAAPAPRQSPTVHIPVLIKVPRTPTSCPSLPLNSLGISAIL